MADVKQHAYGSGELSFAAFKPGTQIPGAYLYFGNTTELTLASEQEVLDHYDTDHGIRQKDDSVVTQLEQSGNFITDNINHDNVAKFLQGAVQTITQASAAASSETFEVDIFGTFQLGVTDLRPWGYRKVTINSVMVGAVAMTEGEDYVVDADRGTVTIVEGGAIILGDDVIVNYDVAAYTLIASISGQKTIEGALKYKSYNPVGKKMDYFFPYVKLTPNGDFSLKNGDDWQALPFSVEALKKGDLEVVYAVGQAVTG